MSRDARPALLTRAFVLLAVADLAYFTAIGVAVLLLPRWATGPVGSDEAGAGLAFGAFAITALVCRPYAGRLADRHGRRRLMLVRCGAVRGRDGGAAARDDADGGGRDPAGAGRRRGGVLRRRLRAARRPGAARAAGRGDQLQLARPVPRVRARAAARRVGVRAGGLAGRLARRRRAGSGRGRARGCADRTATRPRRRRWPRAAHPPALDPGVPRVPRLADGGQRLPRVRGAARRPGRARERRRRDARVRPGRRGVPAGVRPGARPGAGAPAGRRLAGDGGGGPGRDGCAADAGGLPRRRGGDVGGGRVRDPGAVHRDLRDRPSLRAGRRVGDRLARRSTSPSARARSCSAWWPRPAASRRRSPSAQESPWPGPAGRCCWPGRVSPRRGPGSRARCRR